MSLIDEVTNIHEDSHKKWFERWYENENLENNIRLSAAKGYTGYRIQVSNCDDKYLRLRLGNSKTIDLLKDKLGEGFKVFLKEERGTNFLNMKTYTSYIQILWK